MYCKFIRCADCREELPESQNVSRDRRLPCPRCGSLNRMLEIETQGEANAQQTPETNNRQKISATHTERVIVVRQFDLDRQTYSERVERMHDGEVIRRLEHPLNEHRQMLEDCDRRDNAGTARRDDASRVI